MASQSTDIIRTAPRPACYRCDVQGLPLYQELEDRLHGAPGKWDLKRCPNHECGMVWLDPMPVEEDIAKAYQNYYTHQDTERRTAKLILRLYYEGRAGYLAHKFGYYSQGLALWKKLWGMLFHLHPGLMARIDGNIMYLHAQPDGRLLDVGCGSGAWLKMMQELGWCVEGVDIDPSAVENAQKKGLNVRFGTLESQKYPDDHFHTVTINHVIEHVHDPWGLLRESCRIITPGGHLVVATPNTKSWGHGMFKEAWLYLDPPRHLHMFTPEGLRDLAERSGFSRVNVFTTVHAADLVFIGSRSIQRTGRFGKDGPQPRATNVRALGMQLIEWALLRVNPNPPTDRDGRREDSGRG